MILLTLIGKRIGTIITSAAISATYYVPKLDTSDGVPKPQIEFDFHNLDYSFFLKRKKQECQQALKLDCENNHATGDYISFLKSKCRTHGQGKL